VLIRRILDESLARLRYEQSPDGEFWSDAGDDPFGFSSMFLPSWEVDRAIEAGVSPGGVALPFEPASFRDFMAFEKHYIGAARGYVKQFRPRVAVVADTFERLYGRPFPAYRAPRLWMKQPIYYMSNARTFVPSGTRIQFPRYSRALDWELELGFVLKAPLWNAEPDEAEAAIGGFVVLNDFSARDVQIAEQESGFGPQKAKHFLSSLSATGVPAADVLDRWTELSATVERNGQVVARPHAAEPRWTLGEMLAHASASERLLPGELFGSGTFVGGSGMETETWLQPGDHFALSIDGVGSIEHVVAGSM
jgi:2-keto-4-pentenoate hydratase/2-oxohepta-3-ene-1,7-dioic acid hydratase in catechol pathway